MPVGINQKPPANWWQAVNADRNWFSLVKSKSAGQSVGEVVSRADAKLNRPSAKS